MKQPLQTRRFKEALARVQHLFVNTPGVYDECSRWRL